MLQIPTVEIEDLDQLSRAELRDLWERELAEKSPLCLGRDILALGIAYVRQERRYGGLPKPLARELNRLLSRVLDESHGPGDHILPLPRSGTVLVREWRGVMRAVAWAMRRAGLWNVQELQIVFQSHEITTESQ
jgi:hypothetical protein